MRDHNALGLAGGARGEEYLERRLGREPRNRTSFFGRKRGEPVFKGQLRNFGRQLAQQQRIAHSQFRRNVGCHAGGKIRRSKSVQGNGQNATQQAAMEGRDPLRAILSPKQHAIARPNAPLVKQGGKTAGQPSQLAIGGYPAAVALVANHGDLTVVAAEIVEKCSQMIAHDYPGKNHGKPMGCASAGCPRFGAVPSRLTWDSNIYGCYGFLLSLPICHLHRTGVSRPSAWMFVPNL